MPIQAITDFQAAETQRLAQVQTINYVAGSLLAVALLVTGVVLLKVPGADGGAYFYAGAGVAAGAAIPLGVMVGIAIDTSKKKQMVQNNPSQAYLDTLSIHEFFDFLAHHAPKIEGELDRNPTLHQSNQELFQGIAKSKHFGTIDVNNEGHWEYRGRGTGDISTFKNPFDARSCPHFSAALFRAVAKSERHIYPSLLVSLFSKETMHKLGWFTPDNDSAWSTIDQAINKFRSENNR